MRRSLSSVILRRSRRISSLIFLFFIVIQFPTTLEASDNPSIQIRRHPQALPSNAPLSTDQWRRQWAEVTRLVRTAQTNEGAALIRQYLLATNINLVGPWQDIEIIVPSVDLSERLSRRGFFIYVDAIPDFLERPLTREGGFQSLRKMRDHALLSGWSHPFVSQLMNARYGTGLWQRGMRRLAGQRGRDRLIPELVLLAAHHEEEAARALRIISIYDNELRVPAIQALAELGNTVLNARDAELVHYWLFGFDSEPIVLAATQAAASISDPDIVFLLTTELRQIRQSQANVVIEEKLIQALGVVGAADRQLTLEALMEITTNITDYQMPMTQLQRAAYVSMGKLEAFDRFPQDSSLFFNNIPNSWAEIAGDLGMTVGELAEVVAFDQQPQVIIGGEQIHSRFLLEALQQQLHLQPGHSATDLDTALRESIRLQNLSATSAIQQLESNIPRTVEFLLVTFRDNRSPQLFRIAARRLLGQIH